MSVAGSNVDDICGNAGRERPYFFFFQHVKKCISFSSAFDAISLWSLEADMYNKGLILMDRTYTMSMFTMKIQIK